MKLLGTLLALVCLSLQAAEFPVDDAIAGLKAKADYLETIKQVFKNSDCEVTVASNTVKLQPGALRSEGLVMAIAPNYPGNYLAYDRAPKPEFLENVVGYTILKNPGGASVISGRLEYSADDKPAALVVVSNEPRSIKEAEGMFIYEKSGLGLKLNDGKASGKVSGKTAHGQAFSLNCK